jgi:hypothetical protein
MAPGFHMATTSLTLALPKPFGSKGTIWPAPRNSADSPLLRAKESMLPFAARTVRMMLILSPSGRSSSFTSTSGCAASNIFLAFMLMGS